MTTPNNIEKLESNQIFVFGSNLNGAHGGGAALKAKEFGAQDGVGEGLTGQTYAFPTLDKKMEKVSAKALQKSKELLYECATKNPDKQFLVTKVGCGIAGFTEDEMKEVFKSEKPTNIILPAGWSVVRGYKGFQEGLVCRDMQYELGKDYLYEGKIEPCASGYHFCKGLVDVYEYYPTGSVVCEVESEGDVIDEGNKSVTNHIRLIRMLSPEQAKGNLGGNNTGYCNTGHRNTGYRNTGDRNTGDRNTGYSNTGDRNTGYSNTGDRNTGDSNTGHSNTGDSNTGHRNTGDSNTGHRNTGDSNTGSWNKTNYETGFFNTEEPKYINVFNKPCLKTDWDNVTIPSFFYFDTIKVVYFEDMTQEEKDANPSAKTTGLYLKKLDYKEAFKQAYEQASESDKKLVKKLPNFDKDVFFEISGIMID